MLQSHALRGLLLILVVASCAVKAEVFVDDDIQAVVIEGDAIDTQVNSIERKGRQFAFQTLGVPASTSRACINAKGVSGTCAKYAQCYPYFFPSSGVPSWAFGSNDACNYADKETTYQGTCCVTSQAQNLRQVALPWASPWGVPQVQWGKGQQWGQSGQQQWRAPLQRQWAAPVPAGVYPGGFPGALQQGGFPGAPQQGGFPGGLFPGGGIPGGGGLYPGAIGGGIYPQMPQIPQIPQQPQYPQQPQLPPQQPSPQLPQVPGIQQPQPIPVQPQPIPVQPQPVPVQPQPAPVPVQPQPEPEPEPPAGADLVGVETGSEGDGEVGSQCGVGGKAILYNKEGEDEEAARRSDPKFRVKGGWPAEQHEWPWIAQILNKGRQFCGGSLIGPNHILTAAHCIDHMSASDVPTLKVRLGDHDINSRSEAVTQDVGVANIIKHKGFSQRTLHNDVAILKLSSSVKYTKTVRPVCLAPYGANVPGETTATVVGWGMLSHVGPRPDILQEITFKTWDNQRCSSTYGSNAPGGITDHMLCAGQKGQDSCMGDSGGPMVRAIGKTYQQIGIVSWGIACGKEHFPGVYTRVGKMRQWIDKVLAKY